MVVEATPRSPSCEGGPEIAGRRGKLVVVGGGHASRKSRRDAPEGAPMPDEDRGEPTKTMMDIRISCKKSERGAKEGFPGNTW
jgi:hypothetical protein